MGQDLSTAGPQDAEQRTRDGVAIRPLRDTEEFVSCAALQRGIWGDGFGDVVPASLLQVCGKIGGVVAGAFSGPGEELVGFVFGLTGVRRGRLSHWSHMLGVLPRYRGLGIGQRLKYFQREWVAELGVAEILWSFDPLMAGNAHFNINLLRVDIDSYEPEMYGDTGSALHSFGTDRFVARWDLGEMEELAPRLELPVREVIETLPLVNQLPGLTSGPSLEAAKPEFPAVRIEIPRDIFGIAEADPALARSWRESTRSAFKRCFRAGYRVAGFTRLTKTGRCVYLLSREEGALARIDA